MKQILRIYITTLLIIFISFTLVSFIFALLSYFIPMNSLFFHILLEILSYSILLFSAFYFTSHFKKIRLIHSLLFSFLYLLISLAFNWSRINIYHLIMKSSLFSLIALLKTKIKD